MVLSAQFLEAVNGCLLVIYLGVLLFFVRYMTRCWTTGRRRTLCGWYEEVSGAIAISTLVLGDLLIRGPVWLLRHLHNTNRATLAVTWEPFMTWVVLIGVTLGIVGGVCIVREFSSPRLKFVAPLILAILALAFGIGMAAQVP